MVKILVVEDEKIVAMEIKDILLRFGHTVTSVVPSGEEAIIKAKTEEPDLVLMDIMLIGAMDGIQAAYIIQSEFHIPVIFLTAYADSETVERAKKTNPSGFILKPFDVRELQIVIELALNNSKVYQNYDFNNTIIRSIEFQPEYYLSGMSILNYFTHIIRQQYKDEKIRVKIEQDKLKVRLIIETSKGIKEKIERSLEKYGLVLQGEITPEEFVDDPIQLMSLKQQLRLAYYQLENQRELLTFSKLQYSDRIESLEDEVLWLRSHVGELLSHSNVVIKEIKGFILSSFQNKDQVNIKILSAVEILTKILDKGILLSDESEVIQTFTTIKKENPDLAKRFFLFINDLIIKGSISGVTGNLLFEWLKKFL
jgi:two-component system, response regulator PdtaR